MLEQLKEMSVQSLAAGAIVGALFKWIPIILAVPAAFYYCLKIYDWVQEKRARAQAR